MSASLIEGKFTGAAELQRAMSDYRRFIKDDSGVALQKAARETTFALHQEFRRQPPRPRAGSITRAAESRDFRINSLSRSYLAGYQSARRILGGATSGYFRISENGGRVQAVPVVIGRSGRLLAGKRPSTRRGTLLTAREQLSETRIRDIAEYRRFLMSADRSATSFDKRRARLRANVEATGIPSDAVQLNAGALAAIRALNIRERAAAGGYLGAQFLTYKRVRSGRGKDRVTQLTKNNVLAGIVEFTTGRDGAISGANIIGNLPGTSRIAERFGLVPLALNRAAASYQADMSKKLEERAARAFARLGGVAA